MLGRTVTPSASSTSTQPAFCRSAIVASTRPREVGDRLVGGVVEVVVGGVAREAAVEVGPREEVDAVLQALDGARDDLRVDVVVELLLQARLDREGLVEELAVERLLRLVDEDHRDALVVELRPAGAPHHLQHVGHREVDVALLLAVVELGALDDAGGRS